MAYEVFFRVGAINDSIVVEGDTILEIREKTKNELEARNASYRYAIWLYD